MLTTLTPGAQLLSIPRRAARPPKLAPYPTGVGTATMGQETRPATTLGRAPPCQRQRRRPAERRCRAFEDPLQARYTHIDHPGHPVAQELGSDGSLFCNRKVRGAGRHDHHMPLGCQASDALHQQTWGSH